MNKSLVRRLIIGWLIFCVFVSTFQFLGDLLLGMKDIFMLLRILPLYFMIHFIFQVYILLPAIIVYFFLFRRINDSLWLKILFLGMLMLHIQSFLRPDDWNFTIRYGDLKQQISYCLGAVSMVLFDELYVLTKLRGKMASQQQDKLFH